MIELLSPGGNLEKLKIALNYGADAVYAGLSHYSLRIRSTKEFTDETFKEAIDYTHKAGKKFYATANGFPFNSQVKLYERHIEKLKDLGVDALIVSTTGVVALCKKIAPNIPVHLSTQANVLNYLDAQVYQDLGVKRIIAARECSLADLEDIKKRLPDLEIEIFIHGSMCFAYSGRCLISSLQTGRVSNKGSCANDCRFAYELYAKNEESNTLLKIEQDENGTHIFNAKDLNMAAHLEKIVGSGVIDSVKIEGRTKSAYYAAIATRTYRKALDDCARGQFNPDLYKRELDGLKNRGYFDGYLVKRPYESTGSQNLLTAISTGSGDIAALVTESGEFLSAKGQLFTGKDYELITPSGGSVQAVEAQDLSIKVAGERLVVNFKKLITKDGKELSQIHSGNLNLIKLPLKFPPFSIIRTLVE
ncbi:MAG: peptidase U32 family protein [Helicobacteraceae bacterium]